MISDDNSCNNKDEKKEVNISSSTSIGVVGGLFAGLHVSNSPDSKATIAEAASTGTTSSLQADPYDQTPRLSNISGSEKILFYDNSMVLPEAPSLKSATATLSPGDPEGSRMVDNSESDLHDTLKDNRGDDPKSITSTIFSVKEEDDEIGEKDRDCKNIESTPTAFAQAQKHHEESLDDAFCEQSVTLASSSPTLVFSKNRSPLQATSTPSPPSPQSPPLPTRKPSSADNMTTPIFHSSGMAVPMEMVVGKDGCSSPYISSPIPQAAVCLAFLRKFVYKTESHIPTTFGGIKATSLWQYVISPLANSGSMSAKESENLFGPYNEIVRLVFDDTHIRLKQDGKENNNNVDDISVVKSTSVSAGTAIDSKPVPAMNENEVPVIVSDVVRQRAAKSMALFIHLFNIWGHASSAYLESRKDMKSFAMFTELQASIFNTASNLVAYGCLDGVVIRYTGGAGVELDDGSITDSTGTAATTGTDMCSASIAEECTESTKMSGSLVGHHRAANMIVQSVFNSDLSVEKNELFAVKLLLGTSCRVCTSGRDDSLVRGSYLLQSIRTLYHIYLTTESPSNKITARAALQQLVTNVFSKAVLQRVNSPTPNSGKIDFPSENHRDAFLVLRSICKLSMRNLPTDLHQRSDVPVQNHTGLSSSVSTVALDGDKRSEEAQTTFLDSTLQVSDEASTKRKQEMEQMILASAIHPALESKLLALELILYILQNVDFASSNFTLYCGTQFQAAIRNYLCVSLLKNCTAASTKVVSLSLRIFVPTVRHFRTILKAEIEAFVTNVFFVILDSKNSSVEHKRLVVKTFSEICSDPTTLAEIFLNYDCDLSAVDLFHRIVIANGPSETQMEKVRNDSRSLRLDAMRALRQILASLHASIVEPMQQQRRLQYQEYDNTQECDTNPDVSRPEVLLNRTEESISNGTVSKKNLVEIYDSKKKRRAEESEAVLRFNQKPSAGIAYLAKCGHLDDKDPADVARYLLSHKASLDKTQIGEYLGREPDYQSGFSIAVLHEYVRLLDFQALVFDDAIRYFLSGFRLPGEAQKVWFFSSLSSFSLFIVSVLTCVFPIYILFWFNRQIDRIMEKFAERFTEQNMTVFPTADAAFILSFSIIMLNTDLHNPAIKEERRMTKEGFIRNNRGICDGKDLPEELLASIFDRIKSNPISLKEDDEAREKRKGDPKRSSTGLPAALTPASFFSSHYAELDRTRETNFQKERDHIVRTTESFLKRRRNGGHTASKDSSISIKSIRSNKGRQSSRFVLSRDSGLRDEYVSPMFDVTWGPALAAFSTAIESANGTTLGALLQIATDEELELAAENAAEAIEVCLTGFRFAICTAGLCGNSIARDAYMLALSRFSQLGTGVLLEARHIRCVQTMLSLAREDGELLGGSWEHIFRALSEVNRYHQLFQLMARNDRAAARAAERRRIMVEAKEARRKNRDERKAAQEDGESITDVASLDGSWAQSDDDDSLTELGLDGEDDYYMVYDDENMDAKAIDEANAKKVYSGVSETTIEAIYERSSSLSADAVKEFVIQLCQVSRSEIAVGNDRGDLNQVLYRHKHTLLDSRLSPGEFHHGQPNIYNLQKLVEVTHYNMDSRPRLLFSDIWVTVADHLTNVALHSNAAVAMYAVDSFRQLSIQYLKREELEVFEFQKRFLKPLETVMARSDQSSTKELLLNCVDRVIHVFRADESSTKKTKREKGGLRSGWVPILNILGLGGRDPDNGIAQMSFSILSSEIKLCLCSTGFVEVLLADHFVETVQAVLMFVGGAHGDLSLMAIEHVVDLAQFLGNDSLIKSLNRRRLIDTSEMTRETTVSSKNPEVLELWWPLLLGLSQSVGDDRNEIRSNALRALASIINRYFFVDAATNTRHSIIQTLQLIFRGVLTPILEFAETSAVHSNPAPPLPEDFEIFLTNNDDSKPARSKSFDDDSPADWLDTAFDPFMDTCIALCLRAIKEYQELTLIEEVFAILNSCLLSDSGALAVRGLRRLEQFITSDLESSCLNDDVWATICHMLRRCLSVRGLPIKPAFLNQINESDESQEEKRQKESEYVAEIQEFVVQEGLVADRRYVGSNATLVVGLLLSSDRFSVSLRWRLFLTAGLGRGIIEWERTAAILTPPNSPALLTTSRQ
jgi:Sec7-like guanine-nucleotide exchange factor